MEFLLFTLFSSIEYMAMFALLFSLFRLEYKFYHSYVLFISFIMCFVSFTLRETLHIPEYSSIIQLVLLILFFTFMYKQHIFYGIMTVTVSYILYGLIQIGFIGLVTSVGILKMADVTREFSVEGEIVQVGSVLLSLALYKLIMAMKWGFSFIPHTNRVNVTLSGLNLYILIFILAIFAIVSQLYYYLDIHNFSGYFLLAIILGGLLVYLFILYRKKDVGR